MFVDRSVVDDDSQVIPVTEALNLIGVDSKEVDRLLGTKSKSEKKDPTKSPQQVFTDEILRAWKEREGEITIGTDPNCTIAVPDDQFGSFNGVSERHAILKFTTIVGPEHPKGDFHGFLIEDLGSREGTFIKKSGIKEWVKDITNIISSFRGIPHDWVEYKKDEKRLLLIQGEDKIRFGGEKGNHLILTMPVLPERK